MMVLPTRPFSSMFQALAQHYLWIFWVWMIPTTLLLTKIFDYLMICNYAAIRCLHILALSTRPGSSIFQALARHYQQLDVASTGCPYFDSVMEKHLAMSKKERRRRAPHAADGIDLLERISFWFTPPKLLFKRTTEQELVGLVYGRS
jgi:hypothetical protein